MEKTKEEQLLELEKEIRGLKLCINVLEAENKELRQKIGELKNKKSNSYKNKLIENNQPLTSKVKSIIKKMIRRN